VDYLLEALKRRELFGWLRLDPSRAWHGLLFRDRHNWAGISAPLDPELRTRLATQPGALSQVGRPAPCEVKLQEPPPVHVFTTRKNEQQQPEAAVLPELSGCAMPCGATDAV
jgi:Domain of unknown function (DUF1744)